MAHLWVKKVHHKQYPRLTNCWCNIVSIFPPNLCAPISPVHTKVVIYKQAQQGCLVRTLLRVLCHPPRQHQELEMFASIIGSTNLNYVNGLCQLFLLSMEIKIVSKQVG